MSTCYHEIQIEQLSQLSAGGGQCPNSHLNQFVADGQQRIRATDEYRQKVQDIRTRVWTSYQGELAHASLWQRWRLRWKIRREIRQACADLAPDEALYFHG